jgi:HPt (histidine-containing phosphotransfer) domain-containing protein
MEQLVDTALLREISALEDGAVVAEVFGLFLRDAPITLGKIHAATDHVEVARHAHKLKGSSASLGFVALARTCEAVEHAAHDNLDYGALLGRLDTIYAATVDAIKVL